MTDREDDYISVESSNVATGHIGTLIATTDLVEQSDNTSSEIPMPPSNKNSAQDVSTSKHDVFYNLCHCCASHHSIELGGTGRRDSPTRYYFFLILMIRWRCDKKLMTFPKIIDLILAQ